ncbi:hypothetical protein FQN54_006011 [Arachnomyces sp. PD_36]|nr:hypothetical protein FQN54_006011 [Arachnomyces sp. PD_36]
MKTTLSKTTTGLPKAVDNRPKMSKLAEKLKMKMPFTVLSSPKTQTEQPVNKSSSIRLGSYLVRVFPTKKSTSKKKQGLQTPQKPSQDLRDRATESQDDSRKNSTAETAQETTPAAPTNPSSSSTRDQNSDYGSADVEGTGTNKQPPPWPFTESLPFSMYICGLVDQGMSLGGIGYETCCHLYGHDGPIDGGITKLRDMGAPYSEIGLKLVQTFGEPGSDWKRMIITDSRPYQKAKSPRQESVSATTTTTTSATASDEGYESGDPPESPKEETKEKEKEKEKDDEKHSKQLEGEDWFPWPEKLEEDETRRHGPFSILPAPGLPIPEGYAIKDGRAYPTSEAKFCVDVIDPKPAADVPETTVRIQKKTRYMIMNACRDKRAAKAERVLKAKKLRQAAQPKDEEFPPPGSRMCVRASLILRMHEQIHPSEHGVGVL